MSLRYPHIAERLFNTPLLIHGAKLDAIITGLAPRLGIQVDMRPHPEAYTSQAGERRSPGYRVVDGIGVIDVFGALVHRGGMTPDSTYLLGYQELSRMFETALADTAVRAIVLNMDTPGGEVGGVFDLAEAIYQARSVKPVHAVAGNLAASAGYLLASAASSLSITQTGWVGSVGAVIRHADFSAALEQDGISITQIYAGDHKVDGHPYGPLPDSVRADLQAEVEQLRTMLVSAISQYRDMKESDLLGTEARTFMGEAAVAAGLADRIETPDQLITRLASEYSQATYPRATAQIQKETAMSAEQDPAVDSPAAITQEAHDQAVSQARAEATAEATQAERDRIGAIMSHDEANGRQAQALAIALETDMTPEAAAKVLTHSPRVSTDAAAGGTGFEAAMTAAGNVDVGVDGGEQLDDDAAAVAAIVNAS